MKIVKTLVLTFVLAMAGYVYASDAAQTTAKVAKAASCKYESCCKAKPDCCVPGASCCKEGAECCNPQEGCCSPDHRCCKGSDDCCVAGSECARDQCCTRESGHSKTNAKDRCGSSCGKTAAAM